MIIQAIRRGIFTILKTIFTIQGLILTILATFFAGLDQGHMPFCKTSVEA